jgi:hypothetical protein
MKRNRIISFLKRYLAYKPLYQIKKLIDPNSIWPICAEPKYPKYAKFVWKVCKWSLF